MEFRLLEIAPRPCTLCGGANGPFVYVAGVQFYGVPSAEGPKQIEGPILVCIGTAANPGCLPQMARHAPPSDEIKDLRDENTHLLNELDEMTTRCVVQTEKLQRLIQPETDLPRLEAVGPAPPDAA